MAGRSIWLVVPDPLSMRVFADCGIIDGLRERLGDRLSAVVLLPPEQTAEWSARLGDVPIIGREELLPWRVSKREKVRRRLDAWLDRRLGFYPLAIRFNRRHGFHAERMEPGHPNGFLDSRRAGPVPPGERLDRAMLRWHYGTRRYVPSALYARMRDECSAIVFANLQMQVAVPFIVAARRLELPIVGYVASWDHTVGKGVIYPGMGRYIVQTDGMRDDLDRYHEIDRDHVVVTGWPQTDVFHRRRPRAEYDELVRGFGLDPTHPLVLVMGNTPTNAPYEGRFVERLLGWWDDAGLGERAALLVRPHPRDSDWHKRFAAALGKPGVHVQEPSYTDMDVLATLLQHGSCVVSNAGTILLDSLVNDRPAVCVLYDEGAPAGESWAEKNVLGEHYRQLMQSDAFYKAHDFGEVTAGIERALARPDELAEERRRVAREVAGEVDGRAAERVVDAILAGIGERS